MKMYELKKLTNQIENDTNRKIKIIGTTCAGKPAVFLYLNGMLIHTYFLNELYEALINLSFAVNALAFGEKPVEF